MVALLLATSALPDALSEESGMTAEAENGTLLGKARIVKIGNNAWVDGLENDGDGVAVTLAVQESGFYDVAVRVRCSGYKENYIEIDGERVGTVSADSPAWTDAVLERVWLDAGEHTVSILKFWGWTAVDSFSLSPSEPLPADLYDVSAKLCDPDAIDNAKRLMSWLCDIYGKKIITGQYCDSGMLGLENAAIWRGNGGQYPALLGLDLMDYSPSRVARGSVGSSVDKAIDYWNQGGIVTFCWHWNAPEKYFTGNWYSAFYTDSTNIDIAKIMNGEDEDGYQLILRDIDAIAEQLKKLQDAGVPILWRPLHEASGGWFWWGAKGQDAYIQLYRLLYDRLTNVHGLHNLIWVWNGQDAAWYPGDDVVDMIGWDIYAGEHAYASQSATFLEASRVTEARKMIILSENGTVPDIDLIFRDGTVWGSYATWSGDFVLINRNLNKPSEKFTEVSILKKMYQDERSVDRASIPDLTAYPIREE